MEMEMVGNSVAVGAFLVIIIPSDVDMALLDASICLLALALWVCGTFSGVGGLLYVRVYELCLGCLCWLAPCFCIERLGMQSRLKLVAAELGCGSCVAYLLNEWHSCGLSDFVHPALLLEGCWGMSKRRSCSTVVVGYRCGACAFAALSDAAHEMKQGKFFPLSPSNPISVA